LSDDPEEARRARHRLGQWYAAFLQQQAVQLQGAEQTAAIRAIAAEMENIRYSWQWMIAEGALAQIAQAMEGFYLYCFMQQTLREGYELFAVALHHCSALPAGEVAHDNPVALRFRLQLYRAAMVQGIGLTDNVAADLQQCLAYFEEHNMAAESALTMSELGRLASMSGTQQETTRYLQESLARWRARHASWYLTQTLLVIAYESFMQGDFGESRRLAEEMLEIARRTQNHWGMESAMRLLGLNARELGDYATGLSYLQQCLQMVRARANRGLEGYVLENLASLHFCLDEVDKAESLVHASLALANETGQMRLLGYAIHALGEIQMYRDNPAQAEQTFRRALDIFRPQGYRWAEAYVLHTLGQALCRLERFAEALAAQRESIAIANEAGALAIMLTALTAYAETLAFQGEYDRATEIVLATMAHPARESATLKTGKRVLALLADRLGPATAQAIQEQVALPLSSSEGAPPIDQIVAQLCTEILAEL
jgi:tetratricopeptide (TPR) repeat protein